MNYAVCLLGAHKVYSQRWFVIKIRNQFWSLVHRQYVEDGTYKAGLFRQRSFWKRLHKKGRTYYDEGRWEMLKAFEVAKVLESSMMFEWCKFPYSFKFCKTVVTQCYWELQFQLATLEISIQLEQVLLWRSKLGITSLICKKEQKRTTTTAATPVASTPKDTFLS